MTSAEALQKIHATLLASEPTHDVQGLVRELMRSEATLLASGGESKMIAQRHPLGFFACRWLLGEGRTLRLHLWSKQFDWSQEPGWEIHDHVFSFSSLVLFGELRNRMYDIRPEPGAGAGYAVYEVLYNGSESSMRLVPDDVALKVVEDTVESVGMRYSMDASVLHSSDLVSARALTVLATCTDQACPVVPRVISAHQRQVVAFDRSPPLQSQVARLLTEFAQHLD